MQKVPDELFGKDDRDVQIGRRREAFPSMSDFRQDRKSAKPLFNKVFLLWHGPCTGLCERISETSSMIMRTENAVAADKPRSRLPSSRRKAGASWSRRAIAPASNTLMDLESSSRDGDAGIQTRKGHTSLPTSPA
ncbi:hypothetical protein NKH14_32155 [Mesorhizobium sp. M1380]|uniref:hypothetical protein n=1 Tax=Mesorhizobium sp. M1380 TaxID=2957093 RepID=UPI00333875D7